MRQAIVRSRNLTTINLNSSYGQRKASLLTEFIENIII